MSRIQVTTGFLIVRVLFSYLEHVNCICCAGVIDVAVYFGYRLWLCVFEYPDHLLSLRSAPFITYFDQIKSETVAQ